MESTASSPPGRSLPGVAIALLYLILSAFWRIGLELFLAVVVVVLALLDGVDLPNLAAEDLMRVDVLAIGTAVQLGGLVAIAAALTRLLRWDPRRAFALTRPHGAVLAVALVGGLTVGLLPGWIAATLRELLPFLEFGSLEAITKALTEGPLYARVLMVLAITVAAPLFEELVFRGFLWDAFERSIPRWATWLLTSVLFAAYHLDPVHVVAVVFTGLFLGWLRMVSGSVWPSIAAHFVNNALAAALTFTAIGQSDAALPFPAALGAGLFTAALGGIAWLATRKT